jgi:hypothetical protein
MREYLKKGGKLALQGAIWVFALSITWNGKMFFSYAHEILVQNRIVDAIDEELGDLWYKVSETARITFNNVSGRKDDKA